MKKICKNPNFGKFGYGNSFMGNFYKFAEVSKTNMEMLEYNLHFPVNFVHELIR